MPPRQQITRERILDAALTLVEEEGLSQLSARNLARVMGCSTQPVYSSFPSMGELERDLAEHVWKYALDNYLVQRSEQQSFFSMGMGYVAFGMEHPNLFHLLFLSGKTALSLPSPVDALEDPIIEAMERDPFLCDLPRESLRTIHLQMWLFTHGITTMLYADPHCISIEEVRRLMHEMGMKVIMWEMGEHRHDSENCPYGEDKGEKQ